MKQRILFKATVCSAICFFIWGVGTSLSAADIKTRMTERLPVILELKAQGIVGENNQGYLEFVGDQKEKPGVVAAENQDREAVYGAIAKQQGTTAELVGKRRAIQIIQKANPGDWVQDESGKWTKK